LRGIYSHTDIGRFALAKFLAARQVVQHNQWEPTLNYVASKVSLAQHHPVNPLLLLALMGGVAFIANRVLEKRPK
jgi:hypothetical protein